ncbi:chemotaxis protein CheX [Salisediminibacterium halotolerans]|uniref:chemotaxis protein CheX n=1 Tax=Salisediminibacterium halotolerans TaxID=517425 RepID=UPI000EB22C76|nr:chemotaxis protein CheX [Salisediminibacterium halotolerans]RLJ72338.1 chemotaxis protein CheX [Actinophytocola xinjiangensis]RPE85552.1 chemotaxis protein CheX [Salisediminibacterium halotolerans]TWG33507.1 chemotaxis protein CheX [Salisediminibacterium halotolerans]GEL08518.1 hypothetical protein SHA02_19340 [Salisediminibacterium halotolerans]
MEADQINAVYKATKSIMANHFGADITRGQPSISGASIPSDDVSVVLGVKGQLAGQIICSLTYQTAQKIIAAMMGGAKVEQIDEMGWSAIQEFGNWIAGSTATELSEVNYLTDVSPPIVNEGVSKFHSSSKFITIPIDSSLGLLSVHISLAQ